MKYRLLDILVCPYCGNNLRIDIFQMERNNDYIDPLYVRCKDHCYYSSSSLISNPQIIKVDKCKECYGTEIIDGLLICEDCNTSFPIIDSIPRMLSDILKDFPDFLKKYKDKLLESALEDIKRNLSKMMERTKKAFAYEWLNERLGFTGRAETLIGFFAKTGVDPNLYKINFSGYESDCPAEEIHYEPDGSFLKDKLILDVGCGMGRYMNIANTYGGEVIGFDLSRAVEKAKKDTAHNPFSHVIQADIMSPPFKKQFFDFIYSIGVLHHTPNTKESFKRIVPLLKIGGTISLCIYAKSHYPIKNLIERMFRKITTRLPLKVLFYLSYIGVPFGWMQSRLRKNPITFILGSPLFLLQGCEHWDWRIRHTNTFDFFVAPYQWRYTTEEVVKWFDEEAIDDIQILSAEPICIKGVKKV